MTNPYGPPVQRTSGARVGGDTTKPTQADSMPQGRGRGRQAAAVKAEQAGSGWIAPASSNDSETTQLKRAVSAIVAVVVVALLVSCGFATFGPGGLLADGTHPSSTTPTPLATGNGDQYSTQYIDGKFTITTTTIKQGPVDKKGSETLLVTYTLVNNTAITQRVRLALPKLIQKGTELPDAEFESDQEPEGVNDWKYEIESGETMTLTYAYRYAYPGEPVTFERWYTMKEDPNAPLWQASPDDENEEADNETWVWHPY